MSDIEYMSVKEFEGKSLRAEGTRTTAGVVVTVTPASGKTFYLAGGSVSYASGTGATGEFCETQLRNNTAIKERVRLDRGNNPSKNVYFYKWELKGDSLDGTGALNYDVNFATKTGTNTAAGMLYGFIENDADDPRL